jgi:pimeloyl-ACP methyl ester carboxylesterase
MCTESIWRLPDGEDYGTLLRRDLGLSPGYVRYNTGRPVARNGEDLLALLRDLPEDAALTLVGFSLGGLVVRAALERAAAEAPAVRARVRRAVYLGTPHGGAPLERLARGLLRVVARVDDPYARLVGDLAGLRSEAIRDLGDAAKTAWDADLPQFLAAGTWDVMVPVGSATAPFAAGPTDERLRIFPGLGHLALAHHPDVYAQLRRWCEGPASPVSPQEDPTCPVSTESAA